MATNDLVNKATAALTLARQSLAVVQSTVTACADALAAANAAAIPTDTPPPVVVLPPPVAAAKNIYVKAGKLYSTSGKLMPPLASAELMVGADRTPQQIQQMVQTVVSLGATAIAPLPENITNLSLLMALLTAAQTARLVCFFNVDHMSSGRSFLTAPSTVAMLSQYSNIVLRCEVEQGADTTDAQWLASATSFVRALRAAGLTQPIQAGSSDGGRNPFHALAMGKQLIAATDDNLMFTAQMYWSIKTGWYQSLGGLPVGLAGSKAALDAMLASGLLFVPGYDATDDVGDTGSDTLVPYGRGIGLGMHWWVLANGSDPNALVTNATDGATLTARGRTVSSQMQLYPRLPA